jgi:hypothetical protein
MRQHYTPEPVRRFSILRDLLQATIIAALIGAPFAIYFWNMTP